MFRARRVCPPACWAGQPDHLETAGLQALVAALKAAAGADESSHKDGSQELTNGNSEDYQRRFHQSPRRIGTYMSDENIFDAPFKGVRFYPIRWEVGGKFLIHFRRTARNGALGNPLHDRRI
jgi:hypothetical protein